MAKEKIKLKKLEFDILPGSKATPCEICVALNGREIELDKEGSYYVDDTKCHPLGHPCSDMDRANIKLRYLIYIATRSNGPRNNSG